MNYAEKYGCNSRCKLYIRERSSVSYKPIRYYRCLLMLEKTFLIIDHNDNELIKNICKRNLRKDDRRGGK